MITLRGEPEGDHSERGAQRLITLRGGPKVMTLRGEPEGDHFEISARGFMAAEWGPSGDFFRFRRRSAGFQVKFEVKSTFQPG